MKVSMSPPIRPSALATITLTDERPVKVPVADWPILLSESDPHSDSDGHELRVRLDLPWPQHMNQFTDVGDFDPKPYTRCLVYGWAEESSRQAGYRCLFVDVVSAIRKVAERIGGSQEFADKCVAALPPAIEPDSSTSSTK